MPIKIWLKRANGWQRLWLVVSLLGVLYCLLINPFVLTQDARLGRYQYKWAVEREMKYPECQPYLLRPLNELVEPPYVDSVGTSGCYHIYNQRRFNNPVKVPYTVDDLHSDSQWDIWGDILAISGIGFLLAAIFSGLVYFSGWILAWILKGFKSDKQKSSAED